jgi:hypothetical protein
VVSLPFLRCSKNGQFDGIHSRTLPYITRANFRR